METALGINIIRHDLFVEVALGDNGNTTVS